MGDGGDRFGGLHCGGIGNRVREGGGVVVQGRAQVAIVIGFETKIVSICIRQVEQQLWEWQRGGIRGFYKIIRDRDQVTKAQILEILMEFIAVAVERRGHRGIQIGVDDLWF